jgi:hypothetical protein
VTTSSHCPPWCTAQHHRPDYLDHARDIAEFVNGTVEVQVEIGQHVQPGHVGAEVVNVFLHTTEETELILIKPELAASIGRVLLELDDQDRRAFAVALTDAAAVVLMSRATTPATSGSPVEREASPNTPGCEAEPNDGSTDGR